MILPQPTSFTAQICASLPPASLSISVRCRYAPEPKHRREEKAMGVFQRGRVWWYKFYFAGREISNRPSQDQRPWPRTLKSSGAGSWKKGFTTSATHVNSASGHLRRSSTNTWSATSAQSCAAVCQVRTRARQAAPRKQTDRRCRRRHGYEIPGRSPARGRGSQVHQ